MIISSSYPGHAHFLRRRLAARKDQVPSTMDNHVHEKVVSMRGKALMNMVHRQGTKSALVAAYVVEPATDSPRPHLQGQRVPKRGGARRMSIDFRVS